MSDLKIVGTGSATHDNFTVKVNIVKLLNSYLILLTDQQEFGIGTLSLATPSNDLFKTTSSSPFNIFGLKNNNLANLISKTASGKLKAPVLIMVLIKEKNLKQNLITKKVIDALINAIDSIEEEVKEV